MIAKFEIMGNEHVYVKVNGRDVLSFGDGGHEVNLSHFLKPGRLNNITFSFNKGSSFGSNSWFNNAYGST